MDRRRAVAGLLVGLWLLSLATAAEAGGFRRRIARGAVVRQTLRSNHGGLTQSPAGRPFSRWAPIDPPNETNGYGYGLAAAGYGSAYPAHPKGPGWPINGPTRP